MAVASRILSRYGMVHEFVFRWTQYEHSMSSKNIKAFNYGEILFVIMKLIVSSKFVPHSNK